jgi:autonomous glycyl radical cofactor GrcA
MANKLTDIKDRTPHQGTIKLLEELLEDAKKGEIRSVVAVVGFDDNTVAHYWSLDDRVYRRMILAELVMLQHDFTVNLEFLDQESVLYSTLKSIADE